MGNRLTICLLVVTACLISAIGGAGAQQQMTTGPAGAQQQNVAADVATALAAAAKEYASTEALLAKTKAEEAKLAQTKARLDAEAARLGREEGELRRLGNQIDLDQNALNTGLKQTWQSMGCREGRVTTDIPLANRCNAMADQISQRQIEINKRAMDVIARVKRFPNDRQKLSADTVKWAEDTKRIQIRVAELNGTLAALKARLDVCPSDIRKLHRIEEIRLKCGSVQFDGARASLPPCTTDKCREIDRFFLIPPPARQQLVVPETPPSRPVSDRLRATPQWQAFEKKEAELVTQQQATQVKIKEIERSLSEGKGDKGQLQVQLAQERTKETNVRSAIRTVQIEKESFQISFERTPAPPAK